MFLVLKTPDSTIDLYREGYTFVSRDPLAPQPEASQRRPRPPYPLVRVEDGKTVSKRWPCVNAKALRRMLG